MKFKMIQNVIDKLRGKKKQQPNIHYAPICSTDCFSNHSSFVDTKNTLYELYKNHSGYLCNKWEHYFHVYTKTFSHMISHGEPLTLLEIGVQNGGSLQLWEAFLPKGSTIIGVDIDQKCAQLQFSDNIKVYIGDATDQRFLEDNFSHQKFDIIIDDGSHISGDVIKTFQELFPKLKYGGIYIVEDCHSSYWAGYNGGFRYKNSMIEYFKRLVDSLNFNYIQAFDAQVSLEEINLLRELNKEIASITFYDSVIIIEKYMQRKERPFKCYYTKADSIIQPDYILKELGHLPCDKRTEFEKLFKH